MHWQVLDSNKKLPQSTKLEEGHVCEGGGGGGGGGSENEKRSGVSDCFRLS